MNPWTPDLDALRQELIVMIDDVAKKARDELEEVRQQLESSIENIQAQLLTLSLPPGGINT